MKALKFIAIFVAVCLNCFGLSAATAGGNGNCVPVGDLSEKKLVFKGGEKLIFAVHYKWGVVNADVAHATMKVDTTVLNGKKVFRSSILCSTQKLYSSVINVKENLESWFTRDGLVPLKFTRDSREGSYTSKNLYKYNWSAANPHISASLNNSRKGEFSVELPLDKCTYDIPAMFSVIRNMDFSKLSSGKSYPVSFAIDSHVRNLRFTYVGKEDKKVPGLGTVRCFKLGFQVVAGDVFSGDSDLYIWISDDGNRIPVYFIAPLKVGSVQGRLIQYSGLKTTFSSLTRK